MAVTKKTYDSQRLVLSHLLAKTLNQPSYDIQLVQGGETDVGFYFDVLGEIPLNEQTLPTIESAIKKAFEDVETFTFREMMRENAADFLVSEGFPYVAHAVEQEPHNIVSLIQIDRYYGLVDDNFEMPEILPFFKVFRSYQIDAPNWLKEEKQDEMLTLQRFEAAAFQDQKTLKQFLKLQEKAKRWEHVKVGEEQQLFTFVDGIQPVWKGNGIKLKQHLITQWSQCLSQAGFDLIDFDPIGEEMDVAQLKQLGDSVSSNRIAFWFKELNQEQSSRGLFDAPVLMKDCQLQFLPFNQIKEGVLAVVRQFLAIQSTYHLTSRWVIETPSSAGTKGKGGKKSRDLDLLKEVLDQEEVEYEVKETKRAYDEPKLFVHWIDGFGREQAGPSLAMIHHPELEKQQLVAIDSSLFGSIEVFIAILLESYQGELPFHLVPIQLAVIQVGEKARDFAQEIAQSAHQQGFRAEVKATEGKMKEVIFECESQRIPFIAIVGEKEVRAQKVSLREKGRHQQSSSFTIDELIQEMIKSRP